MKRLFLALAAAGLVLAGGAKAAGALPQADPSVARLNSQLLFQLRDAIARGDYPKTTSVLVMRNGRLAYEAYFGDGGPDYLNNTRSVTKFITTLALGAAIHQGAIPSVEAKAFPYLADLGPFQNDTPEKEAITLKDMLSMSSAFACDDNDSGSPGNEDNMHPQADWSRWAVDLPTMTGYRRDATGLGPYRYCTTNAFLMGQVIQRATHTPVNDYIGDKILRPLGIERANWAYSPSHEAMTGGGLELRSRDLAKIAWMVVNDGKWNGRQIVPKAWIDEALTVRRPSGANQNYGYFDFESRYRTFCGPMPMWYMAGNGGSQVLMLRNLRTAIVITRQAYNSKDAAAQTADMLERYVLPAVPCLAK